MVEPARALGVPTVDLFAPMREAPDPSALFFKAGNDHWNAQGQALAARLTVEELEQLGWLKPSTQDALSP